MSGAQSIRDLSGHHLQNAPLAQHREFRRRAYAAPRLPSAALNGGCESSASSDLHPKNSLCRSLRILSSRDGCGCFFLRKSHQHCVGFGICYPFPRSDIQSLGDNVKNANKGGIKRGQPRLEQYTAIGRNHKRYGAESER